MSKEKIEECEKLKAEYLAGWQRARADFLNYKKEEIKRIEELIDYAKEEWLLKILPILDNFYLAVRQNPALSLEKAGLSGQEKKIIDGFLQIKTQIKDFLKNQGVEEIKAFGQKFDPNLHEAVEVIKGKDKETGKIIEEIQKGYKLHGKVIRPAKVKVVK